MNVKPRFKFVNNVKLCELDMAGKHGYKVMSQAKCGQEALYYTDVCNDTGKSLGTECYGILSFMPQMYGYEIEVLPEYRKRDIGELLRLTSIINLIENNLSSITIYSLKKAVYFHSKYKFEPDIIKFEDREDILNQIVASAGSGFDSIIKRAKDLLIQIKANPRVAREFDGRAEAIVKDFITKIQSSSKDEYIKHPFCHGFYMVLTRAKVNENKEFFNDLFKKHGIDYKI